MYRVGEALGKTSTRNELFFDFRQKAFREYPNQQKDTLNASNF
jgi:hypothetical protein